MVQKQCARRALTQASEHHWALVLGEVIVRFVPERGEGRLKYRGEHNSSHLPALGKAASHLQQLILFILACRGHANGSLPPLQSGGERWQGEFLVGTEQAL